MNSKTTVREPERQVIDSTDAAETKVEAEPKEHVCKCKKIGGMCRKEEQSPKEVKQEGKEEHGCKCKEAGGACKKKEQATADAKQEGEGKPQGLGAKLQEKLLNSESVKGMMDSPFGIVVAAGVLAIIRIGNLIDAVLPKKKEDVDPQPYC